MEADKQLVNTGLCYREAFFEDLKAILPDDFWETAAAVLNPDVIVSPPLSLICEQIGHCRLTGDRLNLYIKGKAYEAIALLMDYVETHKASGMPRLSADDRACVEQIAESLKIQLQDPPSITALAKRVGVGPQKLMTDFKRLYGTTVYGYLKRLRMERAAELLQTTNMPVSGVAREVGYHGDGHFQQAFRSVYGIPPKTFRKEVW